MKHYDTVLFDLDGTLLDTMFDIADGVNHAMDAMGYPKRTLEEIRLFVGGGVNQMLQDASGNKMDDEQLQECLLNFKEYYTANMMNKSVPYDGIMQLLHDLNEQGYKVGIVSNKTDDNVQTICKHYFDGLYQFVIGDHESIPRKPEPDGILKAIEELGSEVSKSVYIGDSENDFYAAGNAKVRVFIVDWGFRSREEMLAVGAEEFLATPAELIGKLKTHP